MLKCCGMELGANEKDIVSVIAVLIKWGRQIPRMEDLV